MDDKKVIFVTTLIASMLHMANVDGEYALSEKRYINKIRNKFNEYFDQIEKVINELERADNQSEFILNLLSNFRKHFSNKEIFDLLVHSAKVLTIDGKIEEKEEYLMKSYLLACDLPTELFTKLVERVEPEQENEI